MSHNNSMRISLNKIVFVGYHGLYAEEKKLGNTYIVDVDVDFTPPVAIIDKLEQTIDYVAVYSLLKKWMAIPTPLLETLIGKMADDILLEHAIANKVSIRISKLHLPIPEFEGSVSVFIEKSRNK
ncbi:MAG: dihydroneopterin aldolase [Chitinophagia bacterium]